MKTPVPYADMHHTVCGGCRGPITNPRAIRVGAYLECEDCWPTTVEGWARQRERAARYQEARLLAEHGPLPE